MAKKEHIFYGTAPSGCFWILRIFFITIDESRRAFEQEENEILERDVEENSNLAQKQEQVEVSSIASVVKTFTISCCSGKTRIQYKNSNSSSKGTQNEIIELNAIWEKEEALCNIRHLDHSIKQKEIITPSSTDS